MRKIQIGEYGEANPLYNQNSTVNSVPSDVQLVLSYPLYNQKSPYPQTHGREIEWSINNGPIKDPNIFLECFAEIT